MPSFALAPRWFRVLAFLSGCFIARTASASCDDLPWKFGMSPEEVTAIVECGPYRRFSNGDLETYKGVFNSKEENFQFFFRDNRLWRIGIYLYEGPEASAGAEEWLQLHGTLSRLFGGVVTPGNNPPSSDNNARSAFVTTALQLVARSGKTQMMLIWPLDYASVFSSFTGVSVSGRNFYTVVLYFDRRP